MTQTIQIEQARETSGAKVQSKRIEGYDVARALAIFGMIIVNFKIVMDSSNAGADWLVFFAGLFEGRAVALFVILAGVGLSLLSRKSFQSGDVVARKQAQIRVLKRSAFLLVFGLLLATIWPADILHFYSMYMLIGAILLFQDSRSLVIVATGLVIGFPVLFLLFNYEAGWNWQTLTQVDFWTPGGLLRSLFFNGFHPVFPWAAFLVFGMWLGRQDVKNPQFRKRVIRIALAVLIVTELTVAGLVALFSPESGQEVASFLFSRAPIPPMPFYMLSAGSSAVIILMTVIQIGEQFSQSGWWKAMVTTGQFALTLYVAHIIIGMGIMEFAGWINGNVSLAWTIAYCIAFYLAGVLFSVIWQQRFKRGPFEALMRALTD